MEPQHGFAEAGVRLHHTLWGERGPYVILQHGMGRTARSWDAVCRNLARDHRLAVLDARGFGESERSADGYGEQQRLADFAAVMDGLGWEQPVLVGHSLGGATVTMYAAQHPERLRALVLLEPVLDAHHHWRVTVSPERLQGMRREWASAEAAAERLRQNEMTKHWRADVLEDVLTHEFTTRPDGTIEMKAAPAAYNSEELLADRFNLLDLAPQIDAPLLLLLGSDSTYDREAGQRFADAAPQGAMRMVDGTGHAMYMEQPDEIAERVRAFIASGAANEAAD